MEKGVISYFLKYITHFLGGRNVPFSSLYLPSHPDKCPSHAGSRLELIDSVMWSCLPPLFHLLFTSAWWSKSACAPLQCFFWNIYFISNILILLQATIIPSSELQKQSDIQFPLLQDLGLEFDLFHLSPISLCFISATCYRVCHYPASCSLALWVRSAHIWCRVNICWIRISAAISSCFSGFQVDTWEFHV